MYVLKMVHLLIYYQQIIDHILIDHEIKNVEAMSNFHSIV
jgi:hypothetical protein